MPYAIAKIMPDGTYKIIEVVDTDLANAFHRMNCLSITENISLKDLIIVYSD